MYSIVSLSAQYPVSKTCSILLRCIRFEHSQKSCTCAVASGHLIITGDFNFHMDDINNKEITKFVDLLDSVGLQQRVVGATHSRGHTLDLIIDRQEESLILSPVEIVHELPSDHSAVIYSMDLPRPCLTKKAIRHRALRRMDM